MQCKDSDRRAGAIGRNLSDYERTETSCSRVRGEGGDAENFVRRSLPYPEDVSLPWNDSHLHIANRSWNIIGEERQESSVRSTGSEPLRERRRWLRPHILEPLGYQQTETPPLCTCDEESKEVQDDSRKISVGCSHSKALSDVGSLQVQKFGVHHCANVPCHEPDPLQREHFEYTGNSPSTDNLIYDDHFQCGNMTDSPVAARVPSPSSASSVTSGRRLEWDSGADVGYQNLHLEEKCSENGLSTIERIALARGCSAALFERLEPEGTTGSGKKLKSFQGSHISFNSPLAKSTPVYQLECGVKAAVSLKRKTVTPAQEQFLLPGGYLYIHSAEEHDNEGTPVLEESVAERKEEVGRNQEDLRENTAVSLKKHSASLTDLKNLGDSASHSLPRSQSYLNILSRENQKGGGSGGLPSSVSSRMLGVAYSASSSSVATIVQRPSFSRTTSNKLIQTLPVKASIGVQTSLASDYPNSERSEAHSVKEGLQTKEKKSPDSKISSCQNSISEKTRNNRTSSEKIPNEKVISEKVSIEKEIHRCTGAHKKGSVVSGSSCSGSSQTASSRSQITSSAPLLTSSNIKEFIVQREAKQASDKGSGTLGSASSSTHTAVSSCAAEFRRESVGVVDSAHSFEYLPGHVYETAGASLEVSDSKSKASTSGYSNNKSSSEHKSEKSEMSDKECTSSSPPSLAKDIEDGVKLLSDLVAAKDFSSKAKKTLIRQIINKLVDSDYKEDKSGSEHSASASSSGPWMHAKSSSKPQPAGSGRLKAGEQKSAGHTSGCRHLMKPNLCSDPDEKQRVDAPSQNSSTASSCMPSGSVSVPGDNEESNVESTGFSSHSPSDRAGMDWKLATTRSEQELERTRSQSSLNSNSSSLMRFCKTEREKQLHWIRFEIDHLNNLKQLLEKQEGLTKSLSNLTAHEHKYHQNIKSKSSRPAPTCRVQRSKEVASPDYESSKSESSACMQCQHKSHLPSDGSIKMQPSSSIESHEWNAKILKQTLKTKASRVINDRKETSDKEDTQDVSIPTLTLDSYTLSKADAVNQDSKDGRINVYSQTSPRTNLMQVHRDSQTSLPRAGAEEANQSYHLATKCCCECRRAFEDILEKGVGRQKANEQLEKMSTSCGCQTESLALNEKRRESRQTSNVDSSSLSVPTGSDTSKNNRDITDEEVMLMQRASVATETVFSKSSQTSGSLKKLPIIRPAWYLTEVHGDGEDLPSGMEVKNNHEHKRCVSDVCQCCGLLVNQARVHRKSSSQSKSSSAPQSCESRAAPTRGRIKQQTDVSIEQSKSSLHDVSAQTEIQKSPLAYLLTFEPTAKENMRQKGRKSLPEVKIFVPPHPDSNNSSSCHSNSKGTNSSSKENSRPVSRQCNSAFKLVEMDVEGHENKTHAQTLQEYLQANRPNYLEHADKRSKCLADLAVLRELRRQKRLELLAMTARKETLENAKDVQIRASKSLPSVPKKLALSKQEMREQTERNYRRSKEVQNKLAERKKKEDFRTNRLMAELFTRKLQKKVLKGVVNHSNTASVISSL